MSNEKLRQRYILFFSIALIFTMGLVYAILQSNLEINGTAKITQTSWDVHFDNIQVDSGSVPIGTGDTAATIDSLNPCSLSFAVTFNVPGDYYQFTFDVVNEGGINAKIDTLSVQMTQNGSPVSIPDYLEYYLVKLDGSPVQRGEVIRPGTRETYLVRAGFKSDAESLPSDEETYSYQVGVNYTQADKNDMGTNVSLYHQLRVNESSNVDARTGLYSVCSSVSTNAYCVYYSSLGLAGKIERIDLTNNSRTEIKTLSDNMFYTAMYPVSNGYIFAGLDVVNEGTVISTLDTSFNIINTSTFHFRYAVNLYNITEINGKYYIMTHGLPLDSHLAIEVSSDLQTFTVKDTADLADTSTYEILYTYAAAVNQCEEGQMVSDIKPFNGGYLIVTSPDGQVEDIAQYLQFYRNRQLVWSTQLGNEGAAQIYTKGNRIYMQAEDIENHLTSLDEYSSNGEKLHSTPLDLLDNASRFMMSNFTIGEYNGNLIRLSYLPGNDPTDFTQWSAYRVLTIEISSDVVVHNNDHGSIRLNKSDAFAGETITMTITPDSGYQVSSVTVKDSLNNTITVTNNQFTMPNSAVTIDVVYSNS